VFGVISPNYSCVFEKPEGRAPNLVVIVHGCCSDAHDVYSLKKKFSDAIGRAFSQNPPPEQWEIVIWDWHEHTPKGLLPAAADEAYDAAAGDDSRKGEGNKLANAINQYSIYKHIHLIAHSAGSKLINEAAQTLSELKNQKNVEKPFIHLTFLDAYTPNDEATKGDNSYGYLPDYPNHYAEHYVDRSLPFTDAILENAFNFDITGWIGADKGDPRFLGHWWPVYWYIQSITASEFNYGFPLSLEGGNDQLNGLDQIYPPGKQCSLHDMGTSCLQLGNE
jgi:hypothetical protein